MEPSVLLKWQMKLFIGKTFNFFLGGCMSLYITLHRLIALGPNNVNSDKEGFPKTAMVGNVLRSAISSQSIKRNVRCSIDKELQSCQTRNIRILIQDIMNKDHIPQERINLEAEKIVAAISNKQPGKGGTLWNECINKLEKAGVKNTNEVLDKIFKTYWEKTEGSKRELREINGNLTKECTNKLLELGLKQKDAEDLAEMIMKRGCLKEVLRFNPAEIDNIRKISATIASGNEPNKDDYNILRSSSAMDTDLFGRFVASQPEFTMVSATQVGHAFGVSESQISTDFLIASDDLNIDGAAHMTHVPYTSGLMYHHSSLNVTQLYYNTGKNLELTKKFLQEYISKMIPAMATGKLSKFSDGSAPPVYIMGEKGPVNYSLSGAFLTPCSEVPNLIDNAVKALKMLKKNRDSTYGLKELGLESQDFFTPVNTEGYGTTKELINFLCDLKDHDLENEGV